MSWTSMHFAVGMVGGAAVTAGVACFWRRGLAYTPLGMTLGGLWAIVPDTPRLIRVDYPSLRALPGAEWFGSKTTEAWLHQIGDLFFMHRAIDHYLTDHALAGFFAVIGLYTLGLAGLSIHVARQRSTIARLTRRVRAHAPAREARPVERRRSPDGRPRDASPDEPPPRRRRSDWQRAG
ncbi:MAG: hypothetical protein AAF586_04305 [Planctomycetota bacterium]